jgi:hypothetical protein
MKERSLTKIHDDCSISVKNLSLKFGDIRRIVLIIPNELMDNFCILKEEFLLLEMHIKYL